MRTIGLVVVVSMACGCHGRPPVAEVVRDRVPVAPEPKVAENQPGKAPVGVEPGTTRYTGPRRDVSEAMVPRDMTAVVQQVNGQLQDAFFDYDRAALTPGGIAALREDAALLAPILTEFPQVQVTVEGHCDERGSAEYNLGLGDDRAHQAAELLQKFGVAGARVQSISYGKERPQCVEANESCWQRNRRAHVVIRGAGATG